MPLVNTFGLSTGSNQVQRGGSTSTTSSIPIKSTKSKMNTQSESIQKPQRQMKLNVQDFSSKMTKSTDERLPQ